MMSREFHQKQHSRCVMSCRLMLVITHHVLILISGSYITHPWVLPTGNFTWCYAARCGSVPGFQKTRFLGFIAHAVLSANSWADARPLLRQLHWLPVRQRILYKTAVLAHRANTTGVPAYLKEHLVQRIPSRQTRSAASPLLFVPRLTTDFARRSFSYAAPVIWNSLPTEPQ